MPAGSSALLRSAYGRHPPSPIPHPESMERQSRYGNLRVQGLQPQPRTEGVGKSDPIRGSSDPLFRGDPTRYNPEELLLGALSACHMLWVLHLCADAGIAITGYADEATGEMWSTRTARANSPAWFFIRAW